MRTRIVVITALTAVVGLSTSAWAIASKAKEPVKSEVPLSSQKKVREVTLTASVANPTSTKATISKKQLISKEKIDELVIEKAKKEKLAKQAEVLAKQAEEQEEVARLEKISVDKAEKGEADKAKARKLAQVSANKAKQEEIDRIAAERADAPKQARIAENYKIAKASFDKAEEVKAANLAKTELDKLAKVEADRIAKVKTDSIAKVKTDEIAKKAEGNITKGDSTTKEKADKIAKIEADRIAKIEVDRLNKIEADRLAKKEAARLAKIEADRIAAEKGTNQTALEARIANYLNSSTNVTNVLNRAVALHGGNTSNNCVYFSSEVMRRMGVHVPLGTCNTRQYLSYLNANGWESNWNIKKLTPGSICFTTNDGGGYPTHTFVFMGWANSNYTLAYVADNQGSEVHVRDMRATYSTDKFAYFMHN